MGRENIPQIMWSMRQQTFNGPTSSIGVVDAVSLDHRSPSLIEFRRVIGRVEARRFHRLDEEGAGILCAAEQHAAMLVDIGLQVFVEIKQVRQDRDSPLRKHVWWARLVGCGAAIQKNSVNDI